MRSSTPPCVERGAGGPSSTGPPRARRPRGQRPRSRRPVASRSCRRRWTPSAAMSPAVPRRCCATPASARWRRAGRTWCRPPRRPGRCRADRTWCRPWRRPRRPGGVVQVAGVPHVLGGGGGGDGEAQRAGAGHDAAGEHDASSFAIESGRLRAGRRGAEGAGPRTAPPPRRLRSSTPPCGERGAGGAPAGAAPPSAKAARTAASPSAAICQPLVVSSLDAVGADTGVTVGLVVP